MALHHPSNARPNRRLAIELGVVVVALIGVYLWQRVMRAVNDQLMAALGPWPATLPLTGLATTTLFVAGLVTSAWAYARTRDLDVGLSLPTRADARPIGLSVFAPVVLVGVTKFVGSLTGVPYSTLAETYYTADAPLLPIATLAALGLLLAVPSLVVICQVLVQRSVERALDGDSAIVLTTLVGGFLLTSTTTGGLGPVPELGKLVGAAALVLVLVAAGYVIERVDHDRSRYLVYLPALLFVVLAVLSTLAEVDSLAGGLFALVPFAVIGVAAYAYDRSGSLLVPALAYLSASLAEFVVLVLEAGVLP